MPRLRASGGHRRARGAFLALAVAAVLMASCGDDSSDPALSENRAAALRSTLDEIEVQVDQSDCTAASRQTLAFRQEVDSLPSGVDKSLRDALSGSASRLESLVESQCRSSTPAPADQTTTPAPSDQDQGIQDGQDKKPKKPKEQKGTTGQEGTTGVTGQEGSTGVTGQDGGALAPEGGG